MNRKFITFLSLFVIALLGALHFIASALSLYWTVWWYDYMMHFLAGLGGALASLWVLGNAKPRTLVVVLGCVVLVAISWEVFEYVNDMAGSTESYVLDTYHDILMAILGVGAAGVIASHSKESA
jgi:hypothetical protein